VLLLECKDEAGTVHYLEGGGLGTGERVQSGASVVGRGQAGVWGKQGGD